MEYMKLKNLNFSCFSVFMFSCQEKQNITQWENLRIR